MADPWAGVDLRVHIVADVVYARSYLDLTVDAREMEPPTDEERARGYAERTVHTSAEEAWHRSVCENCALPLPLHPDERRGRPKRRHCREARRRAADL